MAIDAVLFDLDGTLLDRDTSLLAFARDQHRRFAALHAVDEERYVRRFVELDAHGSVWKDKVYAQLLAELAIAGIGAACLLDDYLTNFRRHCVGLPNMAETLALLKRHPLKLGLISNGFGQFQHDNFSALGIARLFDAVLISEWEGLRKPDRAIFDRALAKLGVCAERAVFVGDHPVNDIEAGRAAGLKTVWIANPNHGAAACADATIRDLAELPAIVQALSCQ